MEDNNLLIKYFREETTQEENNRILQWVNASAENEKEFLKIKHLWCESNLNKENIDQDVNAIWTSLSAVTQRKGKGRKLIYNFLRVAAIFILAFGFAWLIFSLHDKNVKTDTAKYEFRTSLGDKAELTLPDGTKVWLNSGSNLNFSQNFDKKSRRVYLAGEAFFDVAESIEGDEFVVQSENVEIKVLGTRFNVMAYPDDRMIETTLEEGKVQIWVNGSEEAELKPGESALYNIREDNIKVNQVHDPDVITSWKDGKVIFINEELEDIAVKLERWYGVEITISNEELKTTRFTGTFENESVEQAFNIIKLTTPLEYTIKKKNVILY